MGSTNLNNSDDNDDTSEPVATRNLPNPPREEDLHGRAHHAYIGYIIVRWPKKKRESKRSENDAHR
jgi:hypothetical protein